MPANSIDDVISSLDALIEGAWEEHNRIGYFAALYRRITHAVQDGIAQNKFADGARMERLDVTFAQRYLDAVTAYRTGAKPSHCWKIAFEAINDDSRLILQHLLAGINAHINLDLGIAAAEVSPGDQLPSLKADFDTINAVLASQVSAVEDEMSALSPLVKNLSLIGLKTETTIINFNIDLARKAAWFAAERLAGEPTVLHDVTIEGLDLAVAIGARAILYPPGHFAALAEIREVEVQDVRSVIETLARSQISNPSERVAP